MNFEWKIAIRFLKEGKGQSIFILLGIGVGVAVQVFLNTLITGLQEDLIYQTVGTNSHVWVSGESKFEQDLLSQENENYIKGSYDKGNEQLSDWEKLFNILKERKDITAISPLIEGNGFITKNNNTSPIIIKGFDLYNANKIYNISERVIEGTSVLDSNKVLIGKELSESFKIISGDVIKLVLPNGANRNFTVAGIFDLGNSASNNSWVILELKQVQKLLNYGNDISKLEMQINEIFEAEAVDTSIEQRFEGIKVDNWIESNSSLLSALKSQSSSSIMIQFFVLLAITLGISSVLAVSVVQKSKQLGILKAMGTKNGQASRIFLLQGLVLGFSGSLIGAVLGIGLIKIFLWGTALGTGVPIFPLIVKYNSVLIIMLIATISSTIAALIPASRSSKLNPVEVIRNG